MIVVSHEMSDRQYAGSTPSRLADVRERMGHIPLIRKNAFLYSFLAGFLSIKKGQIEAAHAPGLNPVKTMRQPEEVVDQILEHTELPGLTQKTITERRALRMELKRIRKQGWALDDEESELGGRCVAAPVFGKSGSLLAAVSVMGPANRVNSETIPDLSILLVKTAGEISLALGHPQDAKYSGS